MSNKAPVQNTLRIEVPGSKGAVHVVQMSDKDETLYCSCPAWKFQHRKNAEHADCKHIRKVLADLGIS